MKRICLVTLFFISVSTYSQISKIEHFFVRTQRAKELFSLFASDFKLPIVWDYQAWGSFSSGAVTLGNVVFEFLNTDSDSISVSYGIALEPIQSALEILPTLRSADILCGEVEPYYYTLKDGTKNLAWSTIILNQILPNSVNLYICDYKQREGVEYSRNKASRQLIEHNGGILGIESAKELIVHVDKNSDVKNELFKIPGISKEEDNLFLFHKGPGIRLIYSNNSNPLKIMIHVYSIEEAKNQLESIDISTIKTKTGLIIDDEELSDIQIELIE